jgi:uncharacterized membrane protein
MPINPLFIITILCINVIVAERLATLPYIRHLSAALLVIILGAIEANVGIIPSASNAPPLYDGIFTYIAPMAIFFLMLGVQIKSLKKAGLPMIANFFIGSVGTMAGVLAGMWFIHGRASIGENFHAIGGMYTGTYIGGSINFNAIALHYGVGKEGSLFAAATAVDNIWSAIWVVVTIFIPKIMKKIAPTSHQSALTDEDYAQHSSDRELVDPLSISALIALGCATMFGVSELAKLFPSVPSVIFLTTIALLLAQIPVVQNIKGNRLLGMFCVYIFLTVIGAHCDIPALMKDGQLAMTLFTLVAIIMLVHGTVIFGLGYLFKQDWDILGIASQANVGGSSTALACAKSLGREDLGLAAILIGALGNATGTYWGILIAEFLRNYL